MLMNPSLMIFYFTLVSGTLLSISSSNWLGMWMGLEMNLLSFIPIMNKDSSPCESESSMKYFLIQAIASVIFLMSILMMSMIKINYFYIVDYFFFSALLMKMGSAPFHFWFPGVMEGMSWMNCFILMTWQKIAPFILISYKLTINYLLIVSIFLSTLIGAVGGLNQTSIRKIMSYSSISHLGWMISAMYINMYMWMMYFITYALMNITLIYSFKNLSLFHLSQMYFINNITPNMKFIMMVNLMSLGGLPPLTGFLPKWFIIQNMVNQGNLLTITFMVMTTLLTLFFYLRLMFSTFMFINQTYKWSNSKSNNYLMTISSMMSLGGLPIMVSLFLY
uniref:NADH-ubiquinone oxidoreductase chain 2 n=1 Tax=Macromia daimoji TaxID=1168648 RepID=A0A411NHD5_9ODON|nr:NADH dehydrogenase subunit 2 [Macromia daimoji]QBF44100.1 NADH dehydrogenase subunit 2 [Macromia daimoji]